MAGKLIYRCDPCRNGDHILCSDGDIPLTEPHRHCQCACSEVWKWDARFLNVGIPN